MLKTKESQYQCCIDVKKKGLQALGLMSSYDWITDPKHLLFVLSRYKFVAKMFRNMRNVLEIGCADAFGTRIVSQATGSLIATDFDPLFVESAKSSLKEPYLFECFVHDILESPIPGSFDGVYSLDVIEHIPKEKEGIFISNIVKMNLYLM